MSESKRSTVTAVLCLATLAAVAAPARPAAAQVEVGWVARYDSATPPVARDEPWALAIDAAGRACVTGSSDGDDGQEVLTRCHDDAGQVAWTARYDGVAGTPDTGRAIAADAAGNVYVGGAQGVTGPTFPGPDFLTLKYGPEGDLAWSVTYDGTAGRLDVVEAIGVDGDGNVYVTGQSLGTGGVYELATVKYDASGVEQWVDRFASPIGEAKVAGLELSPDGHLYVAGTAAMVEDDADFLLLRYTLDGDRLWSGYFSGPVAGNDQCNALAVDAAGDVYLAGQMRAADGTSDYGTVKVAPSGVALWTETLEVDGPELGRAHGVAVAPSGNVVVTGEVIGATAGFGGVTVEYDPAGTELWRHFEPGADARPLSRGTMLAVDSAGAAYLLAGRRGADNWLDFFTYKLGPSGTRLWDHVYGEVGSGDDYAVSVAVDPLGRVLVTGVSHHQGTESNWDYATIQYRQGVLFADGFESGDLSGWSAAAD